MSELGWRPAGGDWHEGFGEVARALVRDVEADGPARDELTRRADASFPMTHGPDEFPATPPDADWFVHLEERASGHARGIGWARDGVDPSAARMAAAHFNGLVRDVGWGRSGLRRRVAMDERPGPLAAALTAALPPVAAQGRPGPLARTLRAVGF